MTAVLLACFAGFCLGALSVGTRLALRRAPSVLAGSFVMNLGALIVVALLALLFGVSKADFDLDALWPFMVIGAVVPGTTQMLYVQAVRDVGPSRTQLVMATAPLVAAVLAVGLLDESWSPLLIVGTLLIVSGGMALAWDKRRPVGFRAIGIAVAVGVAILTGGRDTATRWVLSETEVSPFVEAGTSLFAATVTVAIWAAIRVRRPPDIPALRAAALPFGLVALLMGASYAAFFEAFDRGKVTLVAPLVGTHALWSVAFAVPFLGRSEAIGRRLAVAALLVVAGAAIVSVVRSDDGRVTVEEAVAALSDKAASEPLAQLGPASGVYVYETTGFESVDALLSPTHEYPSMTVVSVEPTRCGYTERWTPLEGRTTERELCRADDAVVISYYRETHTFLGSVHERDYVCDADAILAPSDIPTATDWSFTCDTGHTQETWTGRVIAVEDHPLVGPANVIHIRFDTVLAGRTSGTSTKEFWLRQADGLLLRERVVNESATDTTIGDVNYEETYGLDLVRLTPER